MIYLVVGETGAYSDKGEWYVCYYKEESEADKLAQKLNKLCEKLHSVEYCDYRDYDDFPTADFSVQEVVEKVLDADQHFRMDYTGTRYYVEEVVKGE